MVKVCMDPGDLVLWDSRTIHYACFPKAEQIRYVIYTCFTPRKFGEEEDLKYKGELFAKYQGTTHWPHCVSTPPLKHIISF